MVDALLCADASLPTAVVQVQRSDEALEETVGRARNAAQHLSVPFAYILTTQQEVIELHWLNGSMSEPQLRPTLPERPPKSSDIPNELLYAGLRRSNLMMRKLPVPLPILTI